MEPEDIEDIFKKIDELKEQYPDFDLKLLTALAMEQMGKRKKRKTSDKHQNYNITTYQILPLSFRG
jgi:hypothetical protein